MFKPGDRVQMYRNNEKITNIPERYNGLKGTVMEERDYDGKWAMVRQDGKENNIWYIPASYLKRI